MFVLILACATGGMGESSKNHSLFGEQPARVTPIIDFKDVVEFVAPHRATVNPAPPAPPNSFASFRRRPAGPFGIAGFAAEILELLESLAPGLFVLFGFKDGF